MCVVTEELCEKRRSHIGQRNGFSPECVRRCAVRFAACNNTTRCSLCRETGPDTPTSTQNKGSKSSSGQLKFQEGCLQAQTPRQVVAWSKEGKQDSLKILNFHRIQFKVLTCEKDFEQVVHRYGFSPEWVRR